MTTEMNAPNINLDSLGKKPTVKVVGVGDGGAAIAARIAARGIDGVSFAAFCTNARTLAGIDLAEKRVIGLSVTRGLGAGGDPHLGRASAEADLEVILPVCAGVDMIFLVAGLGGGTGSGATPIVARAARESGALVMALVTLPFDFEGARRQRQALDGLQQLKAVADSVICLPNQRLFKLIDANTPYQDLFKQTDDLLLCGIHGICRLLTQTGLITVDFADLCAVTRGRHVESSFASAEASGESRAEQITERILTHPLLEEGLALAEARSVLVSLQGGPDLTMSEVNRVMERLNRHCESADVTFGAVINPEYHGRLSITVIASRGQVAEVPDSGQNHARTEPRQTESGVELGSELFEAPATSRPASRFVPPPPSLSNEQKEKIYDRQKGGGVRKAFRSARQTQLQLDIVSKGRFEKSEPTLHEGEDLDVPTYIRRGIALN